MSKAESMITSVFPDVPWTGASSIHRSLARGGSLQYGASDHDLLMALLDTYKYWGSVWDHVQKFFGSAEFLLSKDEFSHLTMVDSSRHMRGMGDIDSDQKLLNPNTGNRFHRVALAGDLVIGIRVWCDPEGGFTHIGFRVRVEALDEDEERTRVRMRETMEHVAVEMEVITETIFDIPEPQEDEALTSLTKQLEEAHYA